MADATLLRLWGKTNRQQPDRCHPLLFHMMDVANVARLLWDECLPALIRSRAADALGIPEDDPAGLIAFVCGLHDLGKASPAFQRKLPGIASELSSLGFSFPGGGTGGRHDELTAATLPQLLGADEALVGAEVPLSQLLARIAGAHHGVFPRSDQLLWLGRSGLGGPEWDQARGELVRSLAKMLIETEPRSVSVAGKSLLDPAMILILAGLVSVADWIGSSAEYFPTEPELPADAYAVISRDRAHDALTATGWLPPLRPAAPDQFERVFAKLKLSPNALQQAVTQLAATEEGPYLLIVEAPMGLGKTEAALYAADIALCAGAARGMYIALPTQATSNAMFARVRDDYLASRGHSGRLNLQLVHGNARLVQEYRDFDTSSVHGGPEDSDASVSARSWFTGRKRPLLAPFGVGTIDQSLLGVLQTRHWFVRLFGLANKTVIFDEVHAYDAYTSALLERLIRWLAALDCTVVVLSATLPSARRKALLDAYREGASREVPAVPYPRVTRVSGDQASARNVAVEEQWHRSVVLETGGSEPNEAAQAATSALASGGCGVIVCNTVSRAQEVYQALGQAVPDWESHLFHARMPFGWRRERERQVLAMFGREAERPEQAVLVATQVVEQSLDLDFDWMASDMAPADLLLQRMGRLWRHTETRRPAGLAAPRFLVLCDGDVEGAPPAFGPSEYVYERYILLRSWLAIRQRSTVALPADIEPLVGDVYQESEPAAPDDEWAEALAESKEQMLQRRADAERRARKLLVPEPGDSEDMIEQFNAELEEDDDPNVHPSIQAATRLGDPSVQVVCVLETESGQALPDGMPVSLEASPDAVLTRHLVEASLPLSHRGVFHALKEETPPGAWRSNPHLRFHRVVMFRDGVAAVGGYRLLLDPDLGLVMEREEKE